METPTTILAPEARTDNLSPQARKMLANYLFWLAKKQDSKDGRLTFREALAVTKIYQLTIHDKVATELMRPFFKYTTEQLKEMRRRALAERVERDLGPLPAPTNGNGNGANGHHALS